MKRLITYLLPVILFLAGCSIDEGNNPEAVDGTLPGAMTFVVNVPTPATGPGSYALTDLDEERITSFHVFAFNNSGFVEVSAHKGEIKTDETNGLKKSFEVNFGKLKVGESYNFMVLANISSLMNGKTFTSGMSKTALIEEFKLSGVSKWVAASNDIPMWGESDLVTLTQGMTIPNVTILRMLAKIDASVHTDIQNKFKLSSVYLYNYRNGGYVIPDPGNLVNGSLEKVEKPTLLGDRVKSPAVEYLAADGLTAKACENIIYTFETDTASSGGKIDLENTHALVIGGLFGTDNLTDTTYYRVNFYDKDKNKHLNLLRNHSYEITITGVDGRGYGSAQEAFDSKGLNIETTIQPWDNGGEMNVAFNGQYYLSVSKSKWEFDRNAQEGESLYIKTDYVNGWSYTVDLGNSTEEGWLDLLGWKNGDTESTAQLKLLENTDGNDRTGYILIKAGNLSFQVEVTQTVTSAAKLVESITLVPATTSVYKGSMVNLKATITPEGADNKELQWTSSDNAMATVDATGKVTTKLAGSVTITATAKDGSGKFGTSAITITEGTYVPGTHKGWAGSNIYYNGEHLTFDDDDEDTRKNYQGVFFKWGGLVGMAPNGNFGTGTTYYPITGGSTTGKAYEDIKAVGNDDIAQNRAQTYLYQIHDVDNELGDICKHLTDMGWAPGATHGKRWRMPTSTEMNAWSSSTPTSGTWTAQSTNKDDGTFEMTHGRILSGNRLPAAGFRGTDGSIKDQGTGGYYWSSSPYNTGGYNLLFGSGGVNTGSSYDRQHGFPVRCVVED